MAVHNHVELLPNPFCEPTCPSGGGPAAQRHGQFMTVCRHRGCRALTSIDADGQHLYPAHHSTCRWRVLLWGSATHLAPLFASHRLSWHDGIHTFCSCSSPRNHPSASPALTHSQWPVVPPMTESGLFINNLQIAVILDRSRTCAWLDCARLLLLVWAVRPRSPQLCPNRPCRVRHLPLPVTGTDGRRSYRPPRLPGERPRYEASTLVDGA